MIKAVSTLAILFVLTPRVLAHDFWIEPATYRPAAGSALTIRLMQGEHFRGEPVRRNDTRIEQFIVRGDGGTRAVGGVNGVDPAGRIDEIAAGDAVIGYRTRPLRHRGMTAAAFEAYLREEGLERIIDIRAGRGHAKRGGSEMYSRSAKSLLHAGDPKRFAEPLGYRFEIIPETDPHDRARTALVARLLFEGKPVAGTLVTAMHRDDAKLTAQQRSDHEGRVTLPIAKNGAWLIKAVHMVDAPETSGVDWESIWATLTFERR
ncbi:MAG TPA: DUF4198 domain-containing protein [Thermoanaerobaculia bacterium]|nr:DUF4198 domain-containing protein [Thermoanaerobaculia bacterium]